MTTKKSRKRSQTIQPKNRDEQVGFFSNQSVEIGVEITTDPMQQLYATLVQKATSKPFSLQGAAYAIDKKRTMFLKEMARNLEKDFQIAKKSTSKSFSLNGLEQNPAYKYGVCITKLKDLFKTDQDVEEWLNSHESGLPKTPQQYLEEGKFEVVERLIGMIEYGIPS
jgi:uncharacterized protein (DUF2384 family)